MPFGQSIAARAAVKAGLASMGCDPLTQAIGSRIVGWTVAHLTLDHHSQAFAEVTDTAHDGYNVADTVSDMHDISDHSYLQRSGTGIQHTVDLNSIIQPNADESSPNYEASQEYFRDAHYPGWGKTTVGSHEKGRVIQTYIDNQFIPHAIANFPQGEADLDSSQYHQVKTMLSNNKH